ncbi:MAG: hypothetical protein JAY97_15650 [Candidatus Thiodiazotropha sp. 'RUGA']|nr:hypothetical protein [Candidatus Thiodiazotropha sp. 'RUGA']
MLDLFLVLGDKGESLRKGLLRKAKTILDRDLFELFVKNLKQGLQKNHPYPISQHSVLANFFDGGLSLIDVDPKSDEQPGRGVDPLELAQEELTFGEVAVAQEILENALLSSPERMSLHFGLLEIYQHTHSLSDLLMMQDRLGERIKVAETAWMKTRRYLESQG